MASNSSNPLKQQTDNAFKKNSDPTSNLRQQTDKSLGNSKSSSSSSKSSSSSSKSSSSLKGTSGSNTGSKSSSSSTGKSTSKSGSGSNPGKSTGKSGSGSNPGKSGSGSNPGKQDSNNTDKKDNSNNNKSNSKGSSSGNKGNSKGSSSGNKGNSKGSSSGNKGNSKGSSSGNKGSTAPKENLSAKELTQWKNSVDDIITKKLIPSLKKASDDAVQLHKVTSSGQDANNLSYRFNDLASITSQSAKQLTLFMKNFDTDLTTYINVISKSEKNTSDKMKKSIDQFREAADKISKLKM